MCSSESPYAFYSGWIGGHAYGPRFLTDLSAVMALAIVYIVPRSFSDVRSALAGERAGVVAFVSCLLVLTSVQLVGSQIAEIQDGGISTLDGILA